MQEAAVATAAGTKPNISTVLFDYIQEIARVITKGNQRKVDYIEYLTRVFGQQRANSLIAGADINTEIPPVSSKRDFSQGDSPSPQARLL